MSNPEADAGDEFALIARLFAPLAAHPGARGLKDDAAVWTASGPLVITCDAIVEGVHFLPDDPLDMVAQKALRVNLSDLAAKGAKAEGVLVSLVWPRSRPASGIAAFAAGLEADIAAFGFALLGGDMTSTPGPLVISVTAFGAPVGARAPARADAKPGHGVYVTGTIGDAALGLAVLQGRAGVSEDDAAALAQRYRLPQPRMAMAAWLSAHAGASMDVSDGLIADARKMAAASGIRIELDMAATPLSDPARRAVAVGAFTFEGLVCGGDDYEVLFTAPPEAEAGLMREATRIGLAITRIGDVTAGHGVAALSPDGRDLGLEAGGFVHRIGGG